MRLMMHNPRWAQEFEQARSMLLHATEGWIVDVVHIGGTNVPHEIAQPVIDMVAGMTDLAGLNQASQLVEGLYYARVPAPTWCDQELVAKLVKPRFGDPTHTVLLVRHQSEIWNRILAMQQYLSAHALERTQLQNVKRDHFSMDCGAETRYAEAKNEFFATLEDQIDA